MLVIQARQAVHLFTKKLTDILDRLAPVKKFQIQTKYAPWVSEETKVKIKQRDEAQELACMTRSMEDWAVYKMKRNEVTSLLKKEKLSWQKFKLNECEESQDTGKLWKNMLGWLNWSSSSSPTKLLCEGQIVSAPSKLANIQNQYYINKVKKIREELPQPRIDPLATLRKRMQGRATSVFTFSPVDPDQVEKIISNLKNSKASGIDELDTYILKLVKKEVVPAVCHILNLSIQSNRFPTKWKIAKVVPLYKGKGCKLDSKNYRPVAILPIMSKVLERAIFLQLINYMDTNEYFNPNHHAYRSFHSTTTAMLQMTWLVCP